MGKIARSNRLTESPFPVLRCARLTRNTEGELKMGYLYLVTVALLFSFGGTCVKAIKPFFAPSMITFLRFFVGVFWLLLLKAILRKPVRADFRILLRQPVGYEGVLHKVVDEVPGNIWSVLFVVKHNVPPWRSATVIISFPPEVW